MWRGSVAARASLVFTLPVVVPAGTSGTTPSAPSKPTPLPGWGACGSCKWLPCSHPQAGGICWPWMWAAALLLSTSALIHCPLPCVLLSGVFLHMRSCHGNILHVTVSEIRSLGQVLPAGLCLCNYSSPFRKSSPGPVSQLSAHTTVDLIPSGPSAPVLELCLGFTHRTDTAVISSIWTASTCHSGSWCKNTDVLSELLLVLQAGALHCYQTLFPVLPGFLFSSSP